jgi:hypothetical protein
LTAPALARKARYGEPGFTTGGRVYEHPVTHAVMPSITAVISMLDKPALKFWAARLCAEYAAENIAALADTPPDERIKLIKGAPWASSGKSADDGDKAHDWFDRVIKGETIPDDEIAAASITARRMLKQFYAFVDYYKPEWLASEFTVFSHKYEYAGTADWAARIGPWTVLGDWKTGKSVYPEVGLQLAAIGNADVIVTPDGKETPLPKFNRYAVAHIRPTYAQLHPINNIEECWEAFKAARELKRWKDFAAEKIIGDAPRTQAA